jgi:hypothetical protein
MNKTAQKTLSQPRRRVKIGLKDIAKELDRIAPKPDGSRHNPDWIGRVRRGDGPSPELERLIPKAIANLEAKAANATP